MGLIRQDNIIAYKGWVAIEGGYLSGYVNLMEGSGLMHKKRWRDTR